MQLRQSVIVIWTLFVILSIHAGNKNGDKSSKPGKPKPKPGQGSWGKSWSKSKSRDSRGHRWSSSEDWPCDPFSTTDDFEDDLYEDDFDEDYFEEDDLDFSTTKDTWSTTWSKRNKPKHKHKPPQKKKHRKPCDVWDISSTYDSYDEYTTDSASETTSTTSSEEQTTTETEETVSTVDCAEYHEGCHTVNPESGDTIAPGVCCVHQVFTTCVSCDQTDLCDKSNPDIVCECYEEDDCPTGCDSRCIGLSQSQAFLQDEQADGVMTVGYEFSGVMDNIGILVGVIVVLILLMIGVVLCCLKRRGSKYMGVEGVDMETVGGVVESAKVIGEDSDESVSDMVLPESRTNTMESGSEEVALTALINVDQNIR